MKTVREDTPARRFWLAPEADVMGTDSLWGLAMSSAPLLPHSSPMPQMRPGLRAASQPHEAGPRAATDTPMQIANDDVPLMLSALHVRLQRICGAVGAAETACRQSQDHSPCGQTGQQHRDELVECMAALGQLNDTIRQESLYRQWLEREAVAAQGQLAQLRAALQAAQADEKQARRTARRDSLTRLPNRDFFIERLERALERAARSGRPLAVLFLDLDSFKPVNDTHGHATGDQLLRVVATRLSAATRVDDVVGRLGGDEFACLLEGLDDRQQLARLAAGLVAAVAAPMRIGELILSIRASIGLALFPADGNSAAELLRRADAAMYRAKREGLGCAFYEASCDD